MPHPYDERGRFVPLTCPNPDCTPGKLIYEGHGVWMCDGLVDPRDPMKKLDVCPFDHFDGERYRGGDYLRREQ